MHKKENSPLMSLRRSAATVAISILPQQKPSISLGDREGMIGEAKSGFNTDIAIPFRRLLNNNPSGQSFLLQDYMI
jgi:hypothetical protein